MSASADDGVGVSPPPVSTTPPPPEAGAGLADECPANEAGRADPLRARIATSLWVPKDAPEQRFVASFDAAARPSFATYGAAKHPSTDSEYMHIQLVKRRNGPEQAPYYEVLVDGMKSIPEATEAPGAVQNHALCTHQGWTRDPITRKHIVSPCAVSVFAEDGELLPEKCEVAIYATRPFAPEGELFVGSTTIEPFSASNTIFSPVVVAYPTLYPPPLRIAFFDYGPVYSEQVKKLQDQKLSIGQSLLKTASWTALRKVFENILDNFPRPISWLGSIFAPLIGVGTTTLAGIGLSGLLTLTASIMACPLTGSALESVFKVASKVASNDAAFKNTRNLAVDGVDKLVSAFTGVNLLEGGAKIIETLTGLKTRAEDPGWWQYLVVEPFNDAVNRVYGGESQQEAPSEQQLLQSVLEFYGNTMVAITYLVDSYLDRQPTVEPIRVSFTLAEFARSLTILAKVQESDVITPRSYQDDKAFYTRHRRQLILWQWLQDPASSDGPVSYTKDGIRRTANPLDCSEMTFDTKYGVSTSVQVSIQDNELCTHGHAQAYKFTCQRDDASTLGAVACNAFSDIEDVRTAIATLRDALKKQLQENEASRSRLRELWDELKGGPGNEFFKAAKELFVGVLKGGARKLPWYTRVIQLPVLRVLLRSKNIEKKRMNDELEGLLSASTATIKTVLENITIKLEHYFDENVTNACVGPLELKRRFSRSTGKDACAVTSKVYETQRAEAKAKAGAPAGAAPAGAAPAGPPPAAPAPAAPAPAAQPDVFDVDKFFSAIDNYVQLVNKLKQQLLTVDAPLPLSEEWTWTRYMPQVASPKFFFPSISLTGADSIELAGAQFTVREVAQTQDAVLLHNAYASDARAVLKNMRDAWMREGHGPKSVHFALSLSKTADTIRQALQYMSARAVVDSFALQLAPPSDVLELIGASQTTEETSRRIGAITGESTSRTTSPSVRYAGVKNTSDHILALQFYGELFVHELIDRHCYLDDWQKVAFSVRRSVDERASLVSDFVLAVCREDSPYTLRFADPAAAANDVRTYAQLLALRTHAGDCSKRGSVRVIRRVAQALKEVATTKELDWRTLPVDPLASLRMPQKRATDATTRVADVLAQFPETPGTRRTRQLCAASYPVLLLHNDGLVTPPARGVLEASYGDIATRPDPDYDDHTLNRILLHRFETMRIDFDAGGTDGIDARLKQVVIDDRSKTLGPLAAPSRFYIPFTHGDVLPPLSRSPAAGVLFSTVPVRQKDVLAALDAILDADSKADGDKTVVLMPAFTQCRSSTSKSFMNDPNQVIYDGSTIKFVASSTVGPQTLASIDEGTKAHLLNATSHANSDAYSTIAWNAERILQSILLAKAAQKDVYEVELPPSNGTIFRPIKVKNVEVERLEDQILNHFTHAVFKFRDVIRATLDDVNEQFVKTIEEAKAFAQLGTNASADPQTPLLSQTVSGGMSDGGARPELPFNTDALVALTPEEQEAAEQIFFGTSMPKDDVFLRHGPRFRQLLQRAFEMLYQAQADFRRLLLEFGDSRIEKWIFGDGWLYTSVDGGFEYKLNDILDTKVQLENLSSDETAPIVGKILTLKLAAEFESNIRMVDESVQRLEELRRRASEEEAAETDESNGFNVHSAGSAARFAASLVVGESLARGVLGDQRMPRLVSFRRRDGDSVLSTLKPKLEDVRLGIERSETNAIRLGELCAVVEGLICE